MSAKTESIHIHRLQTLTCWRQVTAIEPLPGGITNHNYLVRDAGAWYVARICEERSFLGIDRRNETVCHRAAHAHGIAPEIVHEQQGTLVIRHLPGRTLTAAEVRDPEMILWIAAVLRALHGSWDRVTGEILYFSVFQTIRTYAATAERLGARLPPDIDELLADTGRLGRRLGPFVPVLCHNDLLASNIIADDERVWLVDWEYAGMGHPLFDLANLSANCAFPEELDCLLLEAYRGKVHARDRAALRLLKAASLLREALWSVIQTVASDIDFDYHQYAEDNLRAYREARGRLEARGA